MASKCNVYVVANGEYTTLKCDTHGNIKSFSPYDRRSLYSYNEEVKRLTDDHIRAHS
jgi:hypothetical protein